MKDPILLKKILREIEIGNVTVNVNGDLNLFKYTQDCAFGDRWNAVNSLCRGLIMKLDGTIVARPFPKFFNLGEKIDPKDLPWKKDFEIWEKMDGSCGIGYQDEELNWHLATPGSMVSDQAIRGTEILFTQYAPQYLPQGTTPVFEIIYPENRIVVDYEGETKLVLLSIFEHNGEEWHPNRVDEIAQMIGCSRPRRYEFGIDDPLSIPYESNAEGYVIRFSNGLRVKAKSPEYVKIHRLLDYCSPKRVIALIRNNEYGLTIKALPKSLQKDFDDIRGRVQTVYYDIKRKSADALDEVMRFSESLDKNLCKTAIRKEQAIYISKNIEAIFRPIVFGLMDGKNVEEYLWNITCEKLD